MKTYILRCLLVVMGVLLIAGSAVADASGKKAVMLVSQSGFKDTEYNQTRSKLEEAGVVITVASKAVGIAKGSGGTKAEVALAYADVNVADFDAVVFIGGRGSPKMVKDSDAQRVAKDAMDAGMIVGAICYAPVVLAKAGVVEGREMTAIDTWGAPRDIKKAGCSYKKSRVHVDGNLITANGPKASSKFGATIAEALAQ